MFEDDALGPFRAGVDPFDEPFAVGAGEGFGFLRHDFFVAAREGDAAGEFRQRVWVFFCGDRTAITALEKSFFGVEAQAPFRFLGAMAAHAMGFEDGFDLLFEIDACVSSEADRECGDEGG